EAEGLLRDVDAPRRHLPASLVLLLHWVRPLSAAVHGGWRHGTLRRAVGRACPRRGTVAGSTGSACRSWPCTTCRTRLWRSPRCSTIARPRCAFGLAGNAVKPWHAADPCPRTAVRVAPPQVRGVALADVFFVMFAIAF